MYTSTLCTHLCIVICEGATDYTFTADGCATDSCAKVQQIIHLQQMVVQQIVVQRCNRLCICSVVDVLCPVLADVLVQCVRVEHVISVTPICTN